jgi:homeobox protein YOX1/YHP1
MQTPRTSNDLRPPHSVYSPASSIPQYQSPASPAYPAGHSTSRGAVPTVAAANTPYQRSMAMSHAPLDHTNPMYRGSRPLPYARAPTAPSPVPYDVPPETQEPTIKKKRKRVDARQLEALNRMYARTTFPSTEERQQLARNLDMSARSVQIWLAHPLVYTSCIIFDLRPFPSGSRTKGGRDVKEDTILPTLRSTRPL